jgi:hypothetical protein
VSRVVEDARRVLGLIAERDVRTLAPLHSERLHEWVGTELASYVDGCLARLDELAGDDWHVASETEVTAAMVRLVVEGEAGTAVVTIRFDQHGRLDGYGVDAETRQDGVGAISIACPTSRVDELTGFYGDLVAGAPLRFGEAGGDYRPPRWGDQNAPQQMHLDLFVSDVETAHRRAVEGGATLLRTAEHSRVYADPIGHAFCIYADDRGGGPPGSLGRVIVDCDNPRVLASFYEELLGMPTRVEDHLDRVVIAHQDLRLPMLGFQKVSPYNAPRWGDPRRPQQMHFDMFFDDADAARALAEALGAVRLSSLGGSCPVYADPAGHPFCVCHPYE